MTGIKIKNYRIILVGAGNVAWHLGHAYKKSGVRIIQILNRSNKTGRALAKELGVPCSTDFGASLPECDFVIVAVRDSALAEVLHQIYTHDPVIIHTSGSQGLDVFPGEINNCGVLYPFQTLTKGLQTDISKIPLCIEARNKDTLLSLRILAGILSKNIWELSSLQRRYLHLSGIIVNNFVNHLVARTFVFMDKQDLNKKLLMPLLDETIRKLDHITPFEAQTGPARRNDLEIIQKHLELLKEEPELKKLYSLLTDSIIAYYSKQT